MKKMIQLTDTLNIPYGNMGIIHEISEHQKLHNRCVALEQSLKSDYDAFALNYRLTLEEFVLSEETKRRIIASGMRYNEQTTRERITNEITRGEHGYSNLLIALCLLPEKISCIEPFIKKQTSSSVDWNSSVFTTELEKFVRSIFRFASKNAHSGEKSSDLVPTNDVCKDYFRKLFHLLCAYYGSEARFDGNLLPFRDYYPIPKSILETCGILLENKKQLYVRRSDSTLTYHLFVPADSKISNTQKRDIETIHRLWMDNIDSPQNVINNPSFVSNKNGTEHCFWVYPLPSFPHSLTDDYINELNIEEKKQIIHGIVRGISSMHHAEPPFYHRTLSPSAFFVCSIRNHLKPLLINFDCVKDTDESAEYTVFYAISDKLSNEELRESIFAPELYSEDYIESDDIDWEKIDIFALGKTILKLYTNSYIIPQSCPSSIPALQYETLLSMLDSNISHRPNIDIVSQIF